HAGGWSRELFLKAARAEGVPIGRERYAEVGERKRPLHESRLFTVPDLSRFDGWPGAQAGAASDRAVAGLPGTPRTGDRLMTLPAFTDVPERFVRECARALRKVADAGARSRVVAPEKMGLPLSVPAVSHESG